MWIFPQVKAAGAWSWPIFIKTIQYPFPFLIKLNLVWEIRQPITSFLRSLQLPLGSHAKTSCPEQSTHCCHTPQLIHGKWMIWQTPKRGNACTFGPGPREITENHLKAEDHASKAGWLVIGRKWSLPNRGITERNQDNPTRKADVPVGIRTGHLPIILTVDQIRADLYNWHFNRR
jgi:hypothetical protein